MINLLLHGREVNTVFDLLGDKENDITYSVGWALAQSNAFVSHLMSAIFPKQRVGEITEIRLQHHGKEGGYTDIEITTESAHAIIEAKRGWTLPYKEQLTKYAHRFKDKSKSNAIVAMSECSPEYVRWSDLPADVKGVPVRHLSWKQVAKIAEDSRRSGTHVEKHLLDELIAYLQGLMTMQNQESNYVYVVVLSSDRADWSDLSWREFTEKKKIYFHPFGGNGWPTEPPNYLGFRYDGQLQYICHVDSYDVVTDLSTHIPEIHPRKWKAQRKWDSYLMYKLGRPIKPSQIVKTGNIYRVGRVWAAFDLLLTCKTIADACDKTKKRLSKG
jgi:hypothetical protein